MFKKFKVFIPVMMLFLTMFLCSCEGDAKIKIQNNGNINFEFNADIGGTFKEMMASMDDEEYSGIDNESISRELLQAGFSNVNVWSAGDKIKISFVDTNKKSILFDYGIVSYKNGNISLAITPENFLKLYNSSGEELQGLLDLFLSPVLNDEVMSEQDYVDTISVAYGAKAGNEIDNSIVKFTITNNKGTTKRRSVAVKKILCGEKIYF